MEFLLKHIDLFVVVFLLTTVITIYFRNNPLQHTRRFMIRRFINWFPLGMTYAFLYMGRYNLNVAKNALTYMTNEDFGIIFAAGTTTYALSFFINGPLVDKIGGKKGMLIAALGAAIFNGAMGVATYLFMHDRLHVNLTLTYSILYSLNMYFQSYGAVSIIKVKAYWFHVRERGIFGAIFGTLISFGVYFAFDWGRAIADASKLHLEGAPTAFQSFIRTVFAIDTGSSDAIWLIFFIPAALLIVWALIDLILLKDSPDQAGFDEFDPMDASSDAGEQVLTTVQLLKKILSNPILLTVAAVEFTSGVLRNGVMQWYLVFSKAYPQTGWEVFAKHWGLIMMVTGVTGGFIAGHVSDKIFHSRRGPPAAILNGVMFVSIAAMAMFLFKSPLITGLSVSLVALSVIGVHSLMSGTAAADFGGRKNTATASGIADAFVYFGSGLQSVTLGYLTGVSWAYWPLFLLPFTVMGLYFASRMWRDLPEATKRYLVSVEKRSVTALSKKGFVSSSTTTVTIKK